MPYYAATGGDPAALLVGILSMVILLIVSGILINLNIKEFKIQVVLYIMILIQLGIAFVDNYIISFPLMGFDARAFESLAWFSYENNVNMGRGAYSYYILNPIYKLLKVRSAIVFEVLNILFTLFININIYEILKKLRVDKKLLFLLMGISALSPISLIYRTGILREAIIIMFISFSVKNFIFYIIDKKNIILLKAFFLIGIAGLFHNGVIFIGVGYLFSLFENKKTKNKFSKGVTVLLILVGIIIFKDKFIEKLGGGEIEVILAKGNSEFLRSAGSAYLKGADMSSLPKLILFLPLKIFYFLYSPTPDMFRGVMDIISFILNSSIYIYLTINIFVDYMKTKNIISKDNKKIAKSLFIGLCFSVIVFSIGTHNAGTAMRHRDKFVLILIIIFSILKSDYKYYLFNKKRLK